MRLTCPNCAAQYEVPADAIPPTGRDVQCSSCGNTWFEQPAESRPRLLDPDPLDDASRVEGDDEEADDLAEMQAAPDPAPVPPRARVAPEVERILREEAEREAQARAEEAARRELPQPEPVPASERPAPRRLRSLDDEEEDGPLLREVPAPPPAPVARAAARPARRVDRELDLDRINSTLRSHGDKLGAKAPQIERAPRGRRRGGFLSGFWGTILILAVLAGLYVWRTDIVEAVPQAAAVLEPYGSAVDRGRFWLDRELARLLGATSIGL